MLDYDFHQLSPYDLEILARDLLQAHWGVTIESFKTGKDGGIDLLRRRLGQDHRSGEASAQDRARRLDARGRKGG